MLFKDQLYIHTYIHIYLQQYISKYADIDDIVIDNVDIGKERERESPTSHLTNQPTNKNSMLYELQIVSLNVNGKAI